MHIARYVRRVRERGYAVVADVIPPERVAALRSAVAAIPADESLQRRRAIYGVRNLLEVCPAARALAAAPELRDLVSPLLGDGCFAVRGILFDKVQGANWTLGWHQDSAIAVRRKIDVPGFEAWSVKAGAVQVQPPAEILARMLTLRVHLDDCGVDNAPLRVVPGSHAHGWLDDAIGDWTRRVDEETCLVRAGGAVAMRPLLLHASARARTPSHRRVLHIEYAAEELPGGLEWRTRIGAADRP